MISGGAAEREDREDEAESDKSEGTQAAPDKIEGALSSALSPEHASNKGEEAPVPLKETRSPSKDKGVLFEPEHTKSLKLTTMHSQAETTIVISHNADKNEGTKLSLDERAQDKNEDEDGIKTPPHSSRRTLKITAKDRDHWPLKQRWLPQEKSRGSRGQHKRLAPPQWRDGQSPNRRTKRATG
jgi:hypothetical protein